MFCVFFRLVLVATRLVLVNNTLFIMPLTRTRKQYTFYHAIRTRTRKQYTFYHPFGLVNPPSRLVNVCCSRVFLPVVAARTVVAARMVGVGQQIY